MSILAILGLLVAAIVLVPVLNILYKVVAGRINLEYYKKQGIKTLFFPKQGYMGMFSTERDENKTRSNYEFIKKLSNQADDQGIVAVNNFSTPSAMIFMYSSELVKEFLIKEDLFAKANAIKRSTYNRLGLFFENGEKLFKSKALFTKIFRYEGMEVFAPIICQIAQRSFNEFNEKNKVTKDGFSKIKLDDLFEPIMKRITNVLIFGKADFPKDSMQEKLHDLLTKIVKLLVAVRQNILYYLAPYLAMKLKLVTETNQLDIVDAEQKKTMAELLAEKEKEPCTGECIMDRIVAHNREMLKAKAGNLEDIMTAEEATGNFNMFQFAGSDTSQNTTKMALCFMADKPELQRFIDGINQEIYDSEGITHTNILDQCEKLENWTKEALRIHSPISIMTNRVALQDVTIGKYKIKKGDNVVFLPSAMNYKEEFYQDPEAFKVDRFSKENEKKLPRYQYIPFTVGKRVCQGRMLGELMLKLLVTQFCRAYEFNKPEGVEYYNATMITIKPMKTWVNVKLK